MLEIHIQKALSHFDLNVSFTVGSEIVVLVGPSGAGKTSILNCIAGITNPDIGYIRLHGDPLFEEGLSLRPQQRGVGYLFQDYALFPHMTVEKNINYGVRKRDATSTARIAELLQVLGIEHLLDSFPHQISGGEKQRVALARALATAPKALLLDEPLSALDRKTRQQCQEELLRLHALWQIPFIVVTHDEQEAEKLADRIFYIEDGKIVST